MASIGRRGGRGQKGQVDVKTTKHAGVLNSTVATAAKCSVWRGIYPTFGYAKYPHAL